MPTAAKLVAAFALALCAYGVSHVVLFRHVPLQQQGISHTLFAVVGFVVGWSKLGPSAEAGYMAGWKGAIPAAVVVYMTCVLVATVSHVYAGMGYHAYNNVDDLMTGFFKKSIEYALLVVDVNVAVASIFGAMLAATFAAMAGRLWR